MPKFGELLATDVWAAAARTLTDISAEEIFDLPEMTDVYPSINPVSSATADTYGSWVQVSADVGVGKRLIGAWCHKSGSGATVSVELEFGEGAAGSEAAIARVPGHSQYGQYSSGYFPLWRSLTDNARLAVRVKDNNASAESWHCQAMVA